MSFVSGLILGLSLIIAIGAQNIWVLSQSMAGANRLVIALVCILCDASLIVIGVYSASELQEWIPEFVPWFTWAGIALLLYLAFGSALRAYNGSSAMHTTQTVTTDWRKTAFTALAISLLNPHVYLDTVLLLGGVGALQPNPTLFAIGACAGSIVWFVSLVSFSPKLKRLLSSTFRWRVFDTVISILLCIVALQLFTFT
ncbi:LysE family transporter [Alteromonas pelagimontana]|uniref:LysE family transporter n=1 Tax=Alteromonas pelagimontana TaxID=1858656 RepID=A0A6M4ME35_9ALTE|nr:LysE family transporter [Alteromonas pelagimontana]QJR80870.1 LysE family transporter [Alteromonas pelagimontana]